MGLDNGINIERNEYSNKIKALKKFEDNYSNDFSICYWRKCWNVRRDIFAAIYTEKGSQYCFALDVYDIEVIIKILKSYNKKTWLYGGCGGSIWEWSEHKWVNRRHIRNLKKIAKLMKKYPELEVYFYDSY